MEPDLNGGDHVSSPNQDYSQEHSAYDDEEVFSLDESISVLENYFLGGQRVRSTSTFSGSNPDEFEFDGGDEGLHQDVEQREDVAAVRVRQRSASSDQEFFDATRTVEHVIEVGSSSAASLYELDGDGGAAGQRQPTGSSSSPSYNFDWLADESETSQERARRIQLASRVDQDDPQARQGQEPQFPGQRRGPLPRTRSPNFSIATWWTNFLLRASRFPVGTGPNTSRSFNRNESSEFEYDGTSSVGALSPAQQTGLGTNASSPQDVWRLWFGTVRRTENIPRDEQEGGAQIFLAGDAGRGTTTPSPLSLLSRPGFFFLGSSNDKTKSSDTSMSFANKRHALNFSRTRQPEKLQAEIAREREFDQNPFESAPSFSAAGSAETTEAAANKDRSAGAQLSGSNKIQKLLLSGAWQDDQKYGYSLTARLWVNFVRSAKNATHINGGLEDSSSRSAEVEEVCASTANGAGTDAGRRATATSFSSTTGVPENENQNEDDKSSSPARAKTTSCHRYQVAGSFEWQLLRVPQNVAHVSPTAASGSAASGANFYPSSPAAVPRGSTSSPSSPESTRARHLRLHIGATAVERVQGELLFLRRSTAESETDRDHNDEVVLTLQGFEILDPLIATESREKIPLEENEIGAAEFLPQSESNSRLKLHDKPAVIEPCHYHFRLLPKHFPGTFYGVSSAIADEESLFTEGSVELRNKSRQTEVAPAPRLSRWPGRLEARILDFSPVDAEGSDFPVSPSTTGENKRSGPPHRTKMNNDEDGLLRNDTNHPSTSLYGHGTFQPAGKEVDLRPAEVEHNIVAEQEAEPEALPFDENDDVVAQLNMSTVKSTGSSASNLLMPMLQPTLFKTYSGDVVATGATASKMEENKNGENSYPTSAAVQTILVPPTTPSSCNSSPQHSPGVRHLEASPAAAALRVPENFLTTTETASQTEETTLTARSPTTNKTRPASSRSHQKVLRITRSTSVVGASSSQNQKRVGKKQSGATGAMISPSASPHLAHGTCPICLHAYDHKVYTQSCGHAFCAGCICKYLEQEIINPNYRSTAASSLSTSTRQGGRAGRSSMASPRGSATSLANRNSCCPVCRTPALLVTLRTPDGLLLMQHLELFQQVASQSQIY
ncbi:unnamed protein product [Amoebophrya sp. A120]|nr:unnamed protein product [Amoebophrya sp. A120]|eukprot:GSA120T00019567001.1